ncbi:hypothetical protein TRFO_13108 [Tritrichomonas foetus]|uniref:Uncharacterized protein n=1 Tax=Tritrichomonas foetus TaxID=1144522 RepID=A0A1J4KZ49_9EUKA|nr:hypothetical protein TRFO_13108 [Tritrichomonas foetus]|eukprot:OHT16527.1 hypothetical protein TRFO_13108 [Tritrichomonas foetus]
MFFLFLSGFVSGILQLSDVQLCLQTYFVDYLGRSEVQYRLGVLGQPFNQDAYNNTSIISYKSKHRIHISSPFWAQYINRKYHYMQMPKVNFNYHSFASIYPPTLYVASINLLSMRSIKINITNILPNTSFTVNGISTTSRVVFLDNIDHKILGPNETVSFTLYFCPTELGYGTAVILIRTSLGVIPYSVCYKAVTSKLDFLVADLFHQSTFLAMNLSVKIPQQIIGRHLSVLYDVTLFNQSKSILNERFLQLSPMNLKSGNYVTFVHMLTPEHTKTIPLFISASNKYLLPIYPVILIGMLTSPNEFIEEEIIIANPTPFNFNVIMISLARDSPINTHVECHTQPLICGMYGKTVIGKITIFGSRQGEIDTTLTIHYESMDGFKAIQTLDIPIKGCVEYGKLEPSEQQIEHMQTEANFHKIYFTNHFNVPVAILSAQTDSLIVQVVNFLPILVMPGEKSSEITIIFQKNEILTQNSVYETVLIVDTNATNHHIPIKWYDGQIGISDDVNSESINQCTQTNVTKSLGKVLVGSTTNFTLYIKNPNPVPFHMRDFNATTGIIVNGYWQGNTSSLLRDHKIDPFSIEDINLYITFNHLKQTTARNDTITIGTGDSSVQIIILWTPIFGSFIVRSTLPRNLRFGKFYNAEININSTYSVSMKLRNITTPIAPININYLTPFLRPGVVTYCGNFSFMLDTSIFSKNKIHRLFNNDLEWSSHRKLWDEYWQKGISYDVPIILHFKSKMFYKINLPVIIEHHHFNDIVFEGGVIMLQHVSSYIANYTNTLDCTVEFAIGTSPNRTIIVAKPKEEVQFPFFIIPERSSQTFFRVPVTNNATPPFFIHVHAKVEIPNLAFIGIDDKNLKSLDFESFNDFRHQTWKKTIVLKNNGALNVSLGKFETTSKLFSVSTNCLKTLNAGESCSADISVILMYLKNHTETSELKIIYSEFWELRCPLKVHLGEKALSGLRRVQKINTIVITLLALIVPMKEIIEHIQKSINLKNDIKYRINNLDAECEVLSMSKKLSVGTQAIFQKVDIGGGSWVPTHTEARIKLTNQADRELENILNTLCT